MSVRKIQGRKYTAKCPNKNCKYTSRIPYVNFTLNNSNSCHSKLCPVHRLPLEQVIYEPKNKKFKKNK